MTDPGTAGDLSEWWRVFDDALLSDLVDEALHQSLDLRTARARLAEARARRGAAGAGLFPTFDASAGASESTRLRLGERAPTATSQADIGFDASWELDIFGGVRRGIEAAEADEAAAVASVDDVRVTLVAEVARSYVEIRALHARLRIAQDNLARQTETVALTQFRAQAGLVGMQDVEQARGNREQTLAQIPTLAISLAEAEHRLDLMLGQPPGTLHAAFDEAGGVPEAPARVAVGIPADALRQRPDVRAAERRLAAETARVGVAEAARYPSFRLSGSIGLDALAQGAVGDGVGLLASLLGGLTAPLFDAGRLKSQAMAQDAVRERALVAYEQAVLTALQDVENALTAVARTKERAAALDRAATAVRNAAELARQSYAAGVTDFQSVIDTERSVLSVEDNVASTRADGVLAVIRLYKALGGGWSPASEPSPAEGEETP